jgi:Ca2+-binding RTX toxin-like protein
MEGTMSTQIGSITLDGSLADWSQAARIDQVAGVNGYQIYGQYILDPTASTTLDPSGAYYLFAVEAPAAIAANTSTTIWLNTDENVSTGYQIFGNTGGAEYSVTFDSTGALSLYAADGTLVSAGLPSAMSADGTVLEFAVPATLIGSPAEIGSLYEVNGSFVPSNFYGPQYQIAAPAPAPVFGPITIDGHFTDWTASDRVDHPASAVPGYEVYGKLAADTYLIAFQPTSASDPLIGPNTTIWLNTDQNTATGFSPFGSVGAEYNVNFAADGKPYLYTGAAGQNLVSVKPLDYAVSADGGLEIAIPRALLTPAGGAAPTSINFAADINDASFLPGDYSNPQYTITDSTTVTTRTPTHKVAIVYSDTSANLYFPEIGETTLGEAGQATPLVGPKTAYSDLIMAAEHQAEMAGVSYDLIDESDLTNINTLIKYDALIFPAMPDVNTAQLPAITSTLTSAVYNYHIGIITAGDFLTNDQNGAALPGNSYVLMQNLLDLTRVSGGNAPVTVTADDITNPIMKGYTAGETIQSYANPNTGYNTYGGVVQTPDVLVDQTVNGAKLNGVVETTTGGTNVHFATTALLGDSNLLSHAIESTVLGNQPGVALHMTRQAGILASRTDMDQSQFPSDVSPTDANNQPVPGIYDKLLPILQQWKQQYNFVGSYFINIGDGANTTDPASTNWAVSAPYYQQVLALGGEIGNHSYTHLLNPPSGIPTENTNYLNTGVGTGTNQFTFDYEFNQSKQIEQTQLGIPIAGAAVPGAPETLATDQNILPYYQSVPGGLTGYVTGGWTGVGSGYPNVIGYLTPTDQNTVYIAPNITFDFTEFEFQKNPDGSYKTVTQVQDDWTQQFNSVLSHSDQPVVVWPWHDYGAAVWDTAAGANYSTQVYTNFIAQAYAANLEFVTLEDLAARTVAEQKATVNYATVGNTITATVTPDPSAPDVGKMALDVVNGGTEVIQNVTNWYAYDTQHVFLPTHGGQFVVNLGASQDDVTHITNLPSRSDLLSLTGDGTNLNFSMVGDGKVVVDLKSPSAEIVSIQGAPAATMTGNELDLTFADVLTAPLFAPLQHDVAIREGATEVSTIGNDIIFGTTGNDVLTPAGSGNDTIIGNGGMDTIVYSGQNTDYKVVANADGSETVTDLRAGSPDGTDTLIGIAKIQFTFNAPPTIALVTDSGISNSDKITNVATVTGAGVAGTTLTLKEGSAVLGSTTVDSTGNWTLTPTPLSDGAHTIVATETDIYGNTGTAAPLTFTLDTLLPTVTANGSVGITNQASQAISGTVTAAEAAIGGTVSLYDNSGATPIGTATVNSDGSWNTTITLAGDGSHSIVAKDTDAAGNTGASGALIYMLDATTPVVTEVLSTDSGISSVDKITKIATLIGTGVAGGVLTLTEGSTVLDSMPVDSTGKWTLTPTLADGPHTIVATETDAFGNTGSSPPLTFTLDTHGPTGWQFALNNSNFDGTSSIGSGTAIGSVSATGDPTNPADGPFTYFFAAGASGAGAAQTMNGLSIDSATGLIIATAAISSSSSTWLVAEDPAGNIFAKQLVFNVGTSAADIVNIANGTAVTFGLGGADSITGTSGSDIIVAGAGNDTIVGFVGADTVNGGAGTDTIRLTATSADLNAATDSQIVNVEAVSASAATAGVAIDLHNQTDGFTITGSSLADTITGSSGADIINTGGGNDTIIGFVGADTVNGGGGTDTIVLTATSADLNVATDARIANVEAISASTATAGVTIDLHNQTDGFTITGSASADSIIGSSGNDTIVGFVGADTVDGGAGTDTIRLTATSADLNAATDARIIHVEAISASTATAGVTIDLHNQTDGFTITGSSSADTITGSSGADIINAGGGNDTIIGFVGADTVNGGGGTDTIVLTATSADLNAATDARIVNVEVISAASAPAGVTIDLHSQTDGFTITGSASADAIIGSSGNDTIVDFVGADTVNGGSGTDTIRLTATSADLNTAKNSQIINVEAISASTATAGVTIDLHNQTDGFTITGSRFADTIVGSSGNDTLSGGTGADTFVFNPGFGKDTITDFTVSGTNHDFLQLSHSMFTAYTTVAGLLASTQVVQVGTDVVVTQDLNDTITLKNVNLATLKLHPADVLFV